MNESQQNEDSRYDIFRRLPRAKKPEADFSTGDPDAPRSEEVPGQVKRSRQEECP